MCGAKLKRSVVPNSAAIYNFQRAFQLEQEEVSWAGKSGAQTGTNAGCRAADVCSGSSSLVQPIAAAFLSISSKMELKQLQQQPELAPATARASIPGTCIHPQHLPAGMPAWPCQTVPLPGHIIPQPANGELGVTRDPWVVPGRGIWDHCLSPWGRDETHGVFLWPFTGKHRQDSRAWGDPRQSSTTQSWPRAPK